MTIDDNSLKENSGEWIDDGKSGNELLQETSLLHNSFKQKKKLQMGQEKGEENSMGRSKELMARKDNSKINNINNNNDDDDSFLQLDSSSSGSPEDWRLTQLVESAESKLRRLQHYKRMTQLAAAAGSSRQAASCCKSTYATHSHYNGAAIDQPSEKTRAAMTKDGSGYQFEPIRRANGLRDSEEEEEETEKEAPTPVNHLVRDLRERDKMALSQRNGSAAAAASGQSSPEIRDCRYPSSKLQVNVVSEPATSASASAPETNCLENGNKPQPNFDLSSYIAGKCQRLKISSPAATSGAESPISLAPSAYQIAVRALRSVSPRYLAQHLPGAASSADRKSVNEDQPHRQQQEQQQSNNKNKTIHLLEQRQHIAPAAAQRRHSAYLFPLMMEQAPHNDDLDNDGDDDDDDSDEQDIDLKFAFNDASGRNRKLAARRHDRPEDEDLHSGLRLRTSTSSPSALSTPINDLHSCCPPTGRHWAPEKKAPDFRGAPKSSQLSKHHASFRLQPVTSVIPLTPRGGSQNRKFSLWNGSSEQLVRGKQQRASLQLNPQQQTAGDPQQVSATTGSGKRRSLIVATSGGHLVNRLSHPRSLFSSNNQQQPPTSGGRQRSSLDSGNNRRNQQQPTPSPLADLSAEHYDPLIPESGYKIVVMGTSGSGKTSIIQRFTYNTFSWRHNPTVEDTYFVEFPYRKQLINISISDTSGTYQFPAMRRLAIASGDAFIFVYSVDNPQSFDEVEQLRQSILDEREQLYSEQATAASSSLALNSTQSSCSALTGGQSQTSIYNPQNLYNNNHNNRAPLHSQHSMQEPAAREHHSGRHWSLASIFSGHHNHNQGSIKDPQQQVTGTGYQPRSSVSSSIYSSSSCSSTESSRRQSVSAAEAALKTRRTRRPPMVIVANKHDLPEEQHLVNSDEIEALAVIDWNNGFVRASAALNLNIEEIFRQVLRQARQPPTLTEAIVSKRRKSLPPKFPHH